jgi:hypothetical protein
MVIRRLTMPLTAAVVALMFGSPAQAELLVSIDKSSQTMTVVVDGQRLYDWPVSTGGIGYDTPSGAFRPFRMDIDHTSDEYDDAPMPYSIFFTRKGHAIHGTYHRGLGRPASHGCVRLSVKNAAKLWRLVRRAKMANTTVVLTGNLPPPGSKAVARAGPEEVDRDDDGFTAALPPRQSRRYRARPRYYYYRARPYVRRYYYRDRGVRFYFRW